MVSLHTYVQTKLCMHIYIRTYVQIFLSSHRRAGCYLILSMIWKTACERDQCWLAEVVSEVLRTQEQGTYI